MPQVLTRAEVVKITNQQQVQIDQEGALKEGLPELIIIQQKLLGV